MKKKFLSILIISIIICTLGCVKAFTGEIITKEDTTEEIEMIKLSIEEMPNKVGEEFEVLFDIPTSLNVRAGDFSIKYPIEKLQFVSSNLNPNFYELENIEEGNDTGTIKCSIINMNIEDENEDVDLSLGALSFKFKVLKSGTATIFTEIEGLYNLEENLIECEDCTIDVCVPFENMNLTFKKVENKNILTGIEEKSTIGVLTGLSSEYIMLVNGEEVDANDETVKLITGTKIQILKEIENNKYEVVDEFIVVIYGDTIENGKIESVDALAVVKNKLGIISFSDKIREEAGRTTIRTRENGTIPTAVDALAIIKNRLDLGKIEQKTTLKYTLTFEKNGGSLQQNEKEVVYNEQYGELPTPTREGYKFNGWYTDRIAGEKIESTSKFMQTTNQTIYAQWTQIFYQNVSTNNVYETLNEAFQEAADGEEIKVVNNKIGENAETEITRLALDKSLTLNTNGKTIKFNEGGISIDGALTITGSGQIIGSDTTTAISNSGTLDVSNVTIKNYASKTSSDSKYCVIYNSGICNLNSGGNVESEVSSSNITSNGAIAMITTESSITNISGGSIIATSSSDKIQHGILNGGTINISEGTVDTYGRSIDTTGTGNLNITGGIIKNHSNMATIRLNSTGKIEITGSNVVKIEGEAEGVISNISSQETAEVIVNNENAEIKGPIGIRNENTGTIKIEQGTIIGTTSYGIFNNNSGRIIVTGGLVKSENGSAILNGKNKTGIITIGNNDDEEVSVTSPRIIGKTYGVVNYTGTFNFYDGVIEGEVEKSIYGSVSDQPSRYTIIKSTVDGRESAILNLE